MGLLSYHSTQNLRLTESGCSRLFDRLDRIIDAVSRVGSRLVLEGVLSTLERGEYRVRVDSSSILLVSQWGSCKLESVYSKIDHRLIVQREEASFPTAVLFANDVYTVLKSGKSYISRHFNRK